MTLEELDKKMAELDELQAETENAHAKLKAQMAELEKLQAETENAHAELIAQIAELKKLKAQDDEKPEPSHPRWMPEIDGKYYYIYSKEAHNTYWGDTTYNIGNYSVGNVFKTKEEAEFAIERLKVLAEMREWAGKWNDIYAIAYVVSYDRSRIIVNERLNNLSYAEIRFATIEAAENCIKAVGEERLKKYYFMVSEEETNNG